VVCVVLCESRTPERGQTLAVFACVIVIVEDIFSIQLTSVYGSPSTALLNLALCCRFSGYGLGCSCIDGRF
jgi:hypothetical protein